VPGNNSSPFGKQEDDQKLGKEAQEPPRFPVKQEGSNREVIVEAIGKHPRSNRDHWKGKGKDYGK
jgi:hypothetical protein